MKKISLKRFLTSILLVALVSVAFAFAGSQLSPGINVASVATKIGAVILAIGFVKGMLNINIPTNAAYNFTISDTTYAGEVASQFIVKSITGADTVNGGHVYVKDGIKKKFTIPRWDADYEDLIQDRAATPTHKGEMTVTGQDLDPANYMIYMEFNPRDFEDHWYATQLDNTLLDRSLPASAESVVVQGVLARHAKYFNKQMWNGDSTTAGIYKYFDGFVKKASDSADTLKVSSPVTLTKTNIQSKFQAGFDLIPAALKYDPEMKIFVSYATFDLYAQSQIDQTYKGIDVTEVGRDTFRGLKVVRIADFPDDTFIIAKGKANMESNLWVGLNSTADEGLKLAPLQANSELWFVKMLMKADVNYGWDSEVVLYEA